MTTGSWQTSVCAILISVCVLFSSRQAFAVADPSEANVTREFIMSCTYGVLAGTLVGAASLAFTDRPGDNLKTVARGASLGLYTGILLGLYVVYIVPGMEEDESTEDPVARRLERMPLQVSLLFNSDDRPDGAKADWTVLRF